MPISLMRNDISECFGEDNACIQNTMKVCKVMCFDFVLKPSSSQLNQTFYDMRPSKWNQRISILGRNCVIHAIWFCTEFLKASYLLLKPKKISLFVSGRNHFFLITIQSISNCMSEGNCQSPGQPTKWLHYQYVLMWVFKSLNCITLREGSNLTLCKLLYVTVLACILRVNY